MECMSLEFVNVRFVYPGMQMPALNGVSIRFAAGERIALIGRNGSGKSTLMLIANGILRPLEGTVYLNNVPVNYSRSGLLRLRQHVGVVFQNPDEQLFTASVLQDLSLGPLNLGLPEDEVRQRVMQVADLCRLTSLLNRPTHALSGGQKTLAALAGMLVMQPTFLFADEITNSLDPWIRQDILDILNQWVEQGHTVILCTHDWLLVKKWARQIIWLENGQVFLQGTPSEVFSDDRLTKLTVC